MPFTPITISSTPQTAATGLRAAFQRINTAIADVEASLALKANTASVPVNLSSLANDRGFVTEAGARAALSVSGDLAYNATTGVLSYALSGIASAQIVDASSVNGASTVVRRDANGDFAARTITAALSGTASRASVLATARTIGLAGDATGTISFDGSANGIIPMALAASGVTAGTYGSGTAVGSFTVDAKGRLTTAASTAIAFPVTSIAGRTGAVTLTSVDITDATAANTASTLVRRDASGNFTAGTITAALTGNASTATLATSAGKLATPRLIALTGDATGSVSFDGSVNASLTMTLGSTGVGAGSYGSTTSVGTFSVDAKGRITAAGSSAIAFPVTTVAGRTGAVALHSADITDATNLGSASTLVRRDGDGAFEAGGVGVTRAGSAIVALRDTTTPSNRYGLKQIISSTEADGGESFLFRKIRMSDNAAIDYELNGPAGRLWHTGNLSFTNNVYATNRFGIQGGDLMVGYNYTSVPSNESTLRVYSKHAYSGGTDGYVCSALSATLYSTPGVRNSLWAIVGVAEDEGDGIGPMVGVFGKAARRVTSAYGGMGGVFEFRDYTGQAEAVGVGAEIDVFANGADSTGEKRVILDLVGGKGLDSGAQAEIGYGLRIGPQYGDNSAARWKRMIGLKGPSEVGLDFQGTYSRTAIRVQQNGAKALSFDAGDTRYLQYQDGYLGYYVPGGYAWQAFEGGGFRVAARSGDPATGHLGEIYYDTATNRFRGYTAAGWREFVMQ